jgi:ABC-type antimicrobial peptide transport system permease subunit
VLFHVPALSLPILAGAVGVLGVVALAACLLPSQRAARMSPMETLAD